MCFFRGFSSWYFSHFRLVYFVSLCVAIRFTHTAHALNSANRPPRNGNTATTALRRLWSEVLIIMYVADNCSPSQTELCSKLNTLTDSLHFLFVHFFLAHFSHRFSASAIVVYSGHTQFHGATLTTKTTTTTTLVDECTKTHTPHNKIKKTGAKIELLLSCRQQWTYWMLERCWYWGTNRKKTHTQTHQQLQTITQECRRKSCSRVLFKSIFCEKNIHVETIFPSKFFAF